MNRKKQTNKQKKTEAVLLVLFFYDIKKLTKILLRTSSIKIVHHHCIQSIPRDPNLKTCLCGFYHSIIGSFFSNITLLRLHVKI